MIPEANLTCVPDKPSIPASWQYHPGGADVSAAREAGAKPARVRHCKWAGRLLQKPRGNEDAGFRPEPRRPERAVLSQIRARLDNAGFGRKTRPYSAGDLPQPARTFPKPLGSAKPGKVKRPGEE